MATRRRKTTKETSPTDQLTDLFDHIETLVKDKFQITRERQLFLTNINNAKAWSTHMILVDPVKVDEIEQDTGEETIKEED